MRVAWAGVGVAAVHCRQRTFDRDARQQRVPRAMQPEWPVHQQWHVPEWNLRVQQHFADNGNGTYPNGICMCNNISPSDYTGWGVCGDIQSNLGTASA